MSLLFNSVFTSWLPQFSFLPLVLWLFDPTHHRPQLWVSDVSKLLLIHSAGKGVNLFIPQWTFYPLHPSISHGQLICTRLTSSIMCSATLTKKRQRNVTIRFCCSHSSSSLRLSCCVISITLLNKIQRMAIKAASNGTFPIFWNGDSESEGWVQ